MNAYNEEEIIGMTVEDFVKQKHVERVIVIDNHSDDNTVERAKNAGAHVITKNSNKGYAHSWYMGLKEALKTDADIIVITDGDSQEFTQVDNAIQNVLPNAKRVRCGWHIVHQGFDRYVDTTFQDIPSSIVEDHKKQY